MKYYFKIVETKYESVEADSLEDAQEIIELQYDSSDNDIDVEITLEDEE